eukprot:scaffold29249_cov35-Phaeocystis_antarctica.AAC.1
MKCAAKDRPATDLRSNQLCCCAAADVCWFIATCRTRLSMHRMVAGNTARLPLGTAALARAPRPASPPRKSTTPASLPPSRAADASAGDGVPAERVQRRCRGCATAV